MKMRFTKNWILIVAICALNFSILKAQIVDVDVNLNVNHKLGNVASLDRAKFINIHADVDDKDWYETDNFTSDLINKFLNGYDVYMGRNTGSIQYVMNSLVRQDASRPGFADVSHIESLGNDNKSTYASNTAYHAYEARNPQILCTQLHPFYPDGTETKMKWAFSQTDTESEPFGTASGEFYAQYIKNFFGEGGTTGRPKPRFIEITNEPLWDLYNEIDNAFKFHSTVAQEIKKMNPDALVAGYCTAFPNFEENNFQRWETRWKKFMDESGEYMDCWSIHLYDFPSINNGKKRLRRGSNVEATLDMLEQYSMMKFGKVKPFVISEFGASSHDYKGAWSAYSDYLHNVSCNALAMQFMERSNNIGVALNYTMLKAKWGSPTVDNVWQARLFRMEGEPNSFTGKWIYSDRVHFYQLWANVNGERVDSKPQDLDIMTDAYVEGNKAYVILNNLAWEPKEVRVNLFEDSNLNIEQLMVKHYRLDNKYTIFDDNGGKLDTTYYTSSNLPAVFNIGSEGTMILEYTFSETINISKISNEVKYYSTDYYKPILINSTIEFNINNVVLGDKGEAVLRLGLGRDHGKSLKPTVKVNGTAISVPDNFRGDEQVDRATFFGVIEIEVPYELLQTNNLISVTFNDAGGFISTATMQVFEFSGEVGRTRDTGIFNLKNTNNLKAYVYPNPAKNYIVFDIKGYEDMDLNIYDLLGNIYIKKRIGKGEKIDVSTLNKGLYLYKLGVNNNFASGTFVIE